MKVISVFLVMTVCLTSKDRRLQLKLLWWSSEHPPSKAHCSSQLTPCESISSTMPEEIMDKCLKFRLQCCRGIHARPRVICHLLHSTSLLMFGKAWSISKCSSGPESSLFKSRPILSTHSTNSQRKIWKKTLLMKVSRMVVFCDKIASKIL